jgi:nicotinamide-nucleotide amidase
VIAEIVSIGTELLLGEIVDTNAAHIARQLAAIGVDHYYSTTVGDNEVRIVQVLRIALGRSDVVITTGGLGPTVDDMTREAVAQVMGRPLVSPPGLMEQVEAFFQRRGAAMTDNNRRQAFVPEEAIVLENPVGTAPAFVAEMGAPGHTDGGSGQDVTLKAVICLPGVPREMTYLMEERVLPYLLSKMGESAVIVSRWVHTVAIGESAVDDAISDLMHSDNPSVGTRAHAGQTDVCITSKATTRELAVQLLDAMEAQIRQRLGLAVYGVDEETLPGVVISWLRRRGLTLALAETVTDGLLAGKLREVDGADSAVVAARNAVDSAALLQAMAAPVHGEEQELASSLAAAVREQHDADLGLAIFEGSGVEPRLWIALATPDGVQQRSWPSRGRSDYAHAWTLHYALDMVRRWLTT